MSTKPMRFGGVVYRYYNAYSRKSDAQRAARELRYRGSKARVVARKGKYATTYEVYAR